MTNSESAIALNGPSKVKHVLLIFGGKFLNEKEEISPSLSFKIQYPYHWGEVEISLSLNLGFSIIPTEMDRISLSSNRTQYLSHRGKKVISTSLSLKFSIHPTDVRTDFSMRFNLGVTFEIRFKNIQEQF